MTPHETILVAAALILMCAVLLSAAIWPLFDTETQAERDHIAELETINAERAARTGVWLENWNAHHAIYADLDPAALDEEAERLARTAEQAAIREPAPPAEPLLVPLPEAGSREPDAVLPPGTPLPDGAIASWVEEWLAKHSDPGSTFVRQLATADLDDIPALFTRPAALALTAGSES